MSALKQSKAVKATLSPTCLCKCLKFKIINNVIINVQQPDNSKFKKSQIQCNLH